MGLIGSVAVLNGHNVLFINRSSNSLKTQYLAQGKPIILRSLKGNKTIHEIKTYGFLAAEDEKVEEAIADPELCILSTAVRQKNFPQVAERIAKGFCERAKRERPEHLFVMACENVRRNSHTLKIEIEKFCSEETKRFLDENVTFLDVVVDRICETPFTENDRIIVKVEEDYEWYINVGNLEKELYDRVSNMFSKTPGVIPVGEPGFGFYETRKLWLVNGIHLLLGIAALLENKKKLPGRGINTVKEALKNDSICLRIQLALDAFAIGLSRYVVERYPPRTRGVSYPEIRGYCNKVYQRLLFSESDRTERLVQDLIKQEVNDEFESAIGGILQAGENIMLKSVEEAVNAVSMEVFQQKVTERIAEPFYYFLEAIKGSSPVPQGVIERLINLAELINSIHRLQYEYYKDIKDSILEKAKSLLAKREV